MIVYRLRDIKTEKGPFCCYSNDIGYLLKSHLTPQEQLQSMSTEECGRFKNRPFQGLFSWADLEKMFAFGGGSWREIFMRSYEVVVLEVSSEDTIVFPDGQAMFDETNFKVVHRYRTFGDFIKAFENYMMNQ